jgi:heme-degrading monooxygenase HmoA
MSSIALTPHPPYYAVIFTSLRTEGDNGYSEMSEKMVSLASSQPGFLGMESVRDGLGITVSYWESLEAIRAWHRNAEHQIAQKAGYQKWYQSFQVRICKVEREYGFEKDN